MIVKTGMMISVIQYTLIKNHDRLYGLIMEVITSNPG